MGHKVWVLGDAVVDLLPDNHDRLLKCPGGAPANVAVGIARLGGQSAFIGRVGHDPFGRFMQQTLATEQVNIDYMYADPTHRTSTVLVDLDEEGERSFTFMVRPSADLFLKDEDLPTFQAKQWLHCCSIALSAEPSRSTTLLAMQQIREAGGYVSFDPNIRPDLWHDPSLLQHCLNQALQLSDVIKLSEDELYFITEQQEIEKGLSSLAVQYPAQLIVITRGKQGVISWYDGKIDRIPCRPVVTVDTTGAGDAFVAGLLAGLANVGLPVQPQKLREIIERAQLCGALATTAKGAMTALPYYHALQKQ